MAHVFENKEGWPLSPPLSARWKEKRGIKVMNGGRAPLTPAELDFMAAKKGKIVDAEVGRRMAGSQFEAAAAKLAETVFLEIVDGKGLTPMAPRAFGNGRVTAYIPMTVDDYKGTDAILLFQHDEQDEEEGVEDRGYPISVDVTTSADQIEIKWDYVTRSLLREHGKTVNWYDTTSSKAGEVFSFPAEGKVVCVPLAIILPPELVLRAGGETAKNRQDAKLAMEELGAIVRLQMRDALEWSAVQLVRMKTKFSRLENGHLLNILKQMSERKGEPRARAAEILYHALKAAYAAVEEMPVNERKYREKYGALLSRDIRQFAAAA
ncbi:MAG: hypothetical protein Q7R83_03960 [bacterium]|nr:hypothetical protein [bacterium]